MNRRNFFKSILGSIAIGIASAYHIPKKKYTVYPDQKLPEISFKLKSINKMGRKLGHWYDDFDFIPPTNHYDSF